MIQACKSHKQNLIVPHNKDSVSTQSVFEDLVWKLDSATPGQRLRIYWHFKLPNGTYSNDTENQILLLSFKYVFWGMLNIEGWYGKTLKSGSAAAFSVGMRELFGWMVYRGLSDFSALTDTLINQYQSDIPLLILNRQHFYGLQNKFDPSPSEIGNKHDSRHSGTLQNEETYTYSQVANRINTLYLIYAQQPLLREQMLPYMADKPFGSKSAGEVCQKIVKYYVNRIPPLPDEISIRLLKQALIWIDGKSHDVLGLMRKLEVHFRNAENLKQRPIAKRIRDEIENAEFSSLNSTSPWLNIEEIRQSKIGLTPLQVFRQLVLRLQASIMIVLLYMVGLRPNELCSIKSGLNPESGLPNCIFVRTSKSGYMNMYYLRGLLSKGLEVPTSEEWLLGCSPVDSKEYPAPVRALIIQQELMSYFRDLAQNDEMFITFVQRKSVPRSAKNVHSMAISTMLKAVRNFIYQECDFSDLEDSNLRGEDLSKYRDSHGLCITSQQGRKTFAAYILESRSSLLKAVSQHFKHISIVMTESAYFPALHRLRGEAESIRTAETVSFFVQVIQGKKLNGAMAPLIEKYFSDLRWKDHSDKAGLVNRVETFVNEVEMRIFFTEYGKCLIAAAPLQSRCNKLGKGASWQTTMPDQTHRSPNLCAGCQCFIIDSDNLTFWHKRKHENEELMIAAKTSGRVHEAEVYRARYEQAKKIIGTISRDN